MNINPFMKKYLADNFNTEIKKIEDDSKVKITFFEDINIDNSEIDFIDETAKVKKEDKGVKRKISKKKVSPNKKKTSTIKKSKTKEKVLEDENISPIKEIKDKKSGWWQK